MADADTAVLDMPDTGIEEEPSPETETEALIDEPETGQADEDGTETEQTITREEAERLAGERVAAREKELAEARDAETKAAMEKWQQEQYEQTRSRAVQARQGAVAQQVERLAKWAHEQGENGKDVTFNPQVIGAIAQQLEEATFLSEWEAINTTGSALLTKHFPNWKPPEPVARAMQQAVYSRDPQRMVTGWFDYMTAAAKDSVRDEVRAEVEAELTDTTKTAAMKEAEAKRKARGGPTPIAGRGAPAPRRSFSTQQEVDMALYKGEIDVKEAKVWLAKGLPYSR